MAAKTTEATSTGTKRRTTARTVDTSKSAQAEKPARQPVESCLYDVLTDIYVRKEPSTDAERLGRVWPGDTLNVICEEGDWLKVAWNGGAAFVRHFDHQYAKKAQD